MYWVARDATPWIRETWAATLLDASVRHPWSSREVLAPLVCARLLGLCVALRRLYAGKGACPSGEELADILIR
jgi:hypothetical protein